MAREFESEIVVIKKLEKKSEKRRPVRPAGAACNGYKVTGAGEHRLSFRQPTR
jgi:hypothetical protein